MSWPCDPSPFHDHDYPAFKTTLFTPSFLWSKEFFYICQIFYLWIIFAVTCCPIHMLIWFVDKFYILMTSTLRYHLKHGFAYLVVFLMELFKSLQCLNRYLNKFLNFLGAQNSLFKRFFSAKLELSQNLFVMKPLWLKTTFACKVCSRSSLNSLLQDKATSH